MSDSYRKRLIQAVYPENPEISMADDPLHKDAAHVITRLRARIAELEQILWVKYDANQKPIKGRYIITEEMIDRAWKRATGRDYSKTDQSIYGGVKALECLGIVACSECSGSGYDDPDIHDNLGKCPDCHRNGKSHGWVWKEEQ